MTELQTLLADHGVWIVAAAVFADQLGLPIPAPPTLVLAGALVGAGSLDATATLAAASLACLPSDLLWFEIGRRRGRGVLRLLCRISLEPDSCVRSTAESFARRGPATLLFAKFVPGLQTIAPPLAGASGLTYPSFLAWSVPAAVLWSGTFLAAGAVLSDEIEQLLSGFAEVGGRVALLAVALLALWIAWKAWHRHRFLRALRSARIDPASLAALYAETPPPLVFDLRHPDQAAADGARLPGARALALEELDERHHEIPRDREIVLYCT